MPIYRTINEAEAKSLSGGIFSFPPTGSEMKQFWLNKEAYNIYIDAGHGQFANGYMLKILVPRELIPDILNTSTQVDQFLFDNDIINSATIVGQDALARFNRNIKRKNIQIIKEK